MLNWQKIFLKQSKGTTFVEIIVYLTIFTLVFGGMLSYTVWLYRSVTKFQAMREVQTSGQRAMESILQQIKTAKSVYTPTTAGGQLSLETIANLPVGETTVSFVDFFICDDRLCIKKEGANPMPLTSSKAILSDLVFSQISGLSQAPSIQVSFQLDFDNPSGQSQYNASIDLIATATLRGY